MAKKTELKDDFGNFLLERVFKDVHEYEIYFEFSNKESADKLSPNRLRFLFKLNGRRLEIFYPDEERVVEFMIPISKSQDNPHTKRKLTKRYINEFGDFIPKVRLSLKNQIAANNKVIGPSDEIVLDLNEAVKRRRAVAAAKAKGILRKNKELSINRKRGDHE